MIENELIRVKLGVCKTPLGFHGVCTVTEGKELMTYDHFKTEERALWEIRNIITMLAKNLMPNTEIVTLKNGKPEENIL